jgi:hypothetical protein
MPLSPLPTPRTPSDVPFAGSSSQARRMSPFQLAVRRAPRARLASRASLATTRSMSGTAIINAALGATRR